MSRIAVDFDGTLADTHRLVVELLNFKHGDTMKPEDVNEWDYFQNRGLGDDFRLVMDMMDKVNLRRAVAPVHPLAAGVVKWLGKTRGHEVEIVTCNDEIAVPSIRAWCFGHGLDFPVVAMGRISASIKASLSYDVYLDDSPKLAAAMDCYPQKKLILVDSRWNQPKENSSWHSNVYRMRSWEGATSFLEDLGL